MTNGTFEPTFMEGFTGYVDPTSDMKMQGWGGLAIGAANSLMNGYMGMKQYGLAKKSLAEGKRQFNLNYDAQRSTINNQLADRQRARLASNPGAYQSEADYMSQWGIKKG